MHCTYEVRFGDVLAGSYRFNEHAILKEAVRDWLQLVDNGIANPVLVQVWHGESTSYLSRKKRLLP